MFAPILDFAVMDMGGRDGETQTNEYSSGQARLVTGSGGWEEGSLRRYVFDTTIIVKQSLGWQSLYLHTDFGFTTASEVELDWKILVFLQTWKI